MRTELWVGSAQQQQCAGVVACFSEVTDHLVYCTENSTTRADACKPGMPQSLSGFRRPSR